MVKLVFCIRRLPALSREEFQRYWRETHGPLVRRHARVLRIRRYVQSHTLEHPMNAALAESRGAPDAFDGVAELWWDSLDDLAYRLDVVPAAWSGPRRSGEPPLAPKLIINRTPDRPEGAPPPTRGKADAAMGGGSSS